MAFTPKENRSKFPTEFACFIYRLGGLLIDSNPHYANISTQRVLISQKTRQKHYYTR